MSGASRLLSRRLLHLRSSASHINTASRTLSTSISRKASNTDADPNITDPEMNGGYVNPPAMKRALRDPYGGWWDQQERRNFGEPIHEDNDTLAVFSTEPHIHVSSGKALFQFGCAIASVLALCLVVGQFYPDRPSVPKTYPGGLQAELGGEKARRAYDHGEGAS